MRWSSAITQLRHFAVAAMTIATIAGCTDETIVYEERPPYNTPADTASGFIGYYDIAPKQTTCGNCHSGYQAAWEQTGHGQAWASLQASPNKNDTCAGCHTVSGNGNAASGTVVGFMKVKDSTYHDVQCESCHGAGLQHVEGVGQGTIIRPLAKVGNTGKGVCGDCHSGAHQPYTEEWSSSSHAVVNTSRATNPSCWGCHEGRKALEKWGVDANFVEKGDAAANQPTTCAICHNPHGSSNPAQLRFPITSMDPQVNLCMKCHLNRAEPTTSSSTSPHAPQGGTLLGDAGWRPPGFVYDTARIFGSHATTKNPKLCAGCHVGRFTVTDAATGGFTFQATGHLMRPIPCLDATGKPTSSKTCAYTATARSWQTCATSGCHASAEVAANAFTTVRSRMKFYTDQIWIDANANGSMQAAPADAGLLPTIRVTKPGEWNSADNMISPAEGAEFNTRLCGEYNQSNSDNSKGVHNPFLCEALMIATINYLKSHYALPAASAPGALRGPVGGEFSGSMHVKRGASSGTK